MKVLSVVKSLGLGGTERSCKNYAALYHEIGYESAILSFSDDYVPLEWLDQYKIDFFFKLEAKSKAQNKKLIDKLKAYAPDVVHIHNNGIQKKDLSDWLPLLSPAPLVLESCHFPLIADYFDYVDIHLQLSHWCLWQFYSALRAKNRRTDKESLILPYVVDSSAFFPKPVSEKAKIRKKLGLVLLEDAFVLGRVGQAYFDKWSCLIFDVFQDIAKKNQNFYLLLVALPEEYKAYIKKLDPETQKRIIVREAAKDPSLLRNYYQSMDLFLHAANQGETFGMVLAEAMLCELPVVSLFTPYRDNSQFEVTGFGRVGLTVRGKKSMKKAVKLLVRDEKKRFELAKKGREWVLEQYSASPSRQKLQNIIEQGLLYKRNKGNKEPGHHPNYTDSKKEVKRQMRMVYGRKYILHLPMLGLLAKSYAKSMIHGKIVYIYRLALGHIPLRSFFSSVRRSIGKKS